MVRNLPIENDGGPESIIDKTLKIHSAISIEITHQLRLTELQAKKARLKQALSLIDQLDFFLESPLKIKYYYSKVQRELFKILESLEIPVVPFAVCQGRESEGIIGQ
jgi:hypothetical protein